MDAAATTAAPDQRDSASCIADPRSLERGLGIFAVHLLLYLATLVGAVGSFPLPVNILFAVANGVFIALLFIVGHDGSHGSLVPQRAWNLWLARFAFIPCAHSASLWRRTHNEHHRRTNLKGVDRVWAPNEQGGVRCRLASQASDRAALSRALRSALLLLRRILVSQNASPVGARYPRGMETSFAGLSLCRDGSGVDAVRHRNDGSGSRASAPVMADAGDGMAHTVRCLELHDGGHDLS